MSEAVSKIEFQQEILKYVSFKAKSSFVAVLIICTAFYFSTAVHYEVQNSIAFLLLSLAAVASGYLLNLFHKNNFKDFSEQKAKISITSFIRLQFYYSLSVSLLIICTFLSEGLLSYAGIMAATAWAIHHEMHVSNCHPLLKACYAISAVIISVPLLGLIFYTRELYESLPIIISALAYGVHIAMKAKTMHKRFVTQFESSLELIKENKRIENFIDMIPAHVSWFDNDLNYLLVNKSLAQIQNRNKSDFVGKKLGFQVGTNNELASYLDAFSKDEGSEDAYFEINLSTDKGPRWTEFYLKKIRKEDTEKFEVIMLGLDREEEKKIAKQLEEERIKNMHSARLASLGEMGAGIAHEIKNPLTIILGQVAFFRREMLPEVVDREKVLERAQKIEQTAYRILKIIEGLRKLSRDSNEQEVAWVSIEEILNDPINLSTEKLRIRGVELTIQNELPDYEIHCQSLQLSQVILNLINNADDIIKEQDLKQIRIHLFEEASQYFISIEDNGPGVKDESRLFTPFYTTKPPGIGTGLGLSISRKILERNGGQLTYKRKDGRTCFRLQFPSDRVRPKQTSDSKAA